jgi:polyisoprenyl-teichoic acid--peptidoglycan teichoic acid transferase
MRVKSLLNWMRKAVCITALITYIPALVALLTLDIVPGRYLFVAIPIYSFIVLVVAWFSLRTNTVISSIRSILLIIIALAICLMNMYVYMASRATESFINIVQQPKTSYVEYVIVADKNRAAKLESAQSVGMIQADSLYEDAKTALKDETSAYESGYSDLTSLTEGVKNGTIELAAIRKANMDILQENYTEFYNNLVVLGTFKVKGEQSKSVHADVTKPFIVYISGIDTYGDVSEVSRSDVNMLAVVNPTQRTMLLVNTPRDYYVQLHGTAGTPDKLTHAGIYGIDMSRQTLEDVYGVSIPYHIRLNFTSLVKTVDTVGSIDVYSDYDFKSFHKGYNTVNSSQALDFARERYSFQDGDRQRGKNQQRVIEAIVNKTSEPHNIIRYSSILGSLQGALQTNIDQQSITKLVKIQLDDMKRWKVESISVDGTGATLPTYSMGAMPLYVMVPNQISVDAAKAKIQQYIK